MCPKQGLEVVVLILVSHSYKPQALSCLLATQNGGSMYRKTSGNPSSAVRPFAIQDKAPREGTVFPGRDSLGRLDLLDLINWYSLFC